VPQVTPINAAIESIRESQKALSSRATFLRQHKTAINRLMAPLVKAHNVGLLSWEPCLSADRNYTGSADGHMACISATMRGLNGFKDARLMALLERYVHADDAKTSDWAESLNRDFEFTFKLPDGHAIKVTLVTYVRSDSETCRKVLKEVKTRVIEDKTYEMVCD
jgi:hypothetical protein